MPVLNHSITTQFKKTKESYTISQPCISWAFFLLRPAPAFDKWSFLLMLRNSLLIMSHYQASHNDLSTWHAKNHISNPQKYIKATKTWFLFTQITNCNKLNLVKSSPSELDNNDHYKCTVLNNFIINPRFLFKQNSSVFMNH